MGRIETIEKLQQHAQAIKAMGATSLYLFGSTARGEANSASDLDLFIDYDPASRFNALIWSASSSISKTSFTCPSM